MSTSSSSADDELTLSLPSLAFVALLALFAIRWFWTSSSRTSGASSTSSSSRASSRGINPEHVEQISQMFPQLNRRDIMWDLRRNGGSVTATTERILQGRGLERPPPSFQPDIPPPSSTPYTASSPSAPAPKNPDLITRYNLQARINEQAKADAAKASSSGWSTNKGERAQNLQKRRDDMILAARRKMLAKEKAGQVGDGGSGSSA